MTKEQWNWLASYDRQTGELSTFAARDCGYGDAIKAGLAVNRGSNEIPDLFITAKGRAMLNSEGQQA